MKIDAGTRGGETARMRRVSDALRIRQFPGRGKQAARTGLTRCLRRETRIGALAPPQATANPKGDAEKSLLSGSLRPLH